MNRGSHRVVAITVLVISCAMFQQTGAQIEANPNRLPGTSIFAYKESTFDDSRRARLVTLMPEIYPVAEWPTVNPVEGEMLPALVWRLYFPGTTVRELFPFPRTSSALVDQIQRVNGIADVGQPIAARSLRVPPLPPAANLVSFKGQINTAHVTSVDNHDVWTTTDQGKTWQPTVWFSKGASGFAPGYSELTVPRNVSPATLQALNTLSAIAPVGQVSLEAPSDVATCSPAKDWITQSAYYSAAQKLVNDNRAEILKLAARDKFVILDFGFDTGHGAKVLSAAKTALEAFGIPRLADHIVTIELDPTANAGRAQKELQNIYVEYLTAYGEPNGINETLAAPGALWMIRYKGGNDAATEIDAIVLQAALWKATKIGKWWNLSWWSRRPIMIYPPFWSRLVNDTGMVGVVAAGNEGAELNPDYSPQNNSRSFMNWLNVTHGSQTGTVNKGNRKSTTGGSLVDTIGPGCGHAVPPLTPTINGSSFASPFVGVVAWLKHLVDKSRSAEKGTSAPVINMRREIWFASGFSGDARKNVGSEGVFDASRLLASEGTHYLTTNRPAIVRLGRAQINAGSCGVFSSTAAPRKRATFSVVPNGSAFSLVIREEAQALPGGVVRECVIEPTFHVELTLADATVKKCDARQFVAEIREVVF